MKHKETEAVKRTYSTSEIAKLFGIHPNTVRLYEEWEMITPPRREDNGYRIFTDLHIDQLKLARIALQTEVLQNGLRKTAIKIIKASAHCDFEGALKLTEEFVRRIDSEMRNVGEAVSVVEEICLAPTDIITIQLKRKEVSQLLDIPMDTLRNWEMNGLVTIKRKKNGYRVYTDNDIRRFKIIRTLRCANYSLSAIRRMLAALDDDRTVDIHTMLNVPGQDETIVSACDKLEISLKEAKKNAIAIRELLIEIKEKY